MPRSTSPAQTARSTRSVETSSTISMSPSWLSRAYSIAASSENDPRMPITPTRRISPTGAHRLGEADQFGVQRRRVLVVQGLDDLQVVIKAEAGAGDAGRVDLHPGAQEVPHPAVAAVHRRREPTAGAVQPLPDRDGEPRPREP